MGTADPNYLEPPSANLLPGQYQIGSMVFGYNTQIPVRKVEVQTYNVNAQDFQVIRTDERSFGIDTLAPGNIVFTMAVLDNYPLPNVLGLGDEPFPPSLVTQQGLILPALAKEWKANEIRPIWGQTKPIYFCDLDGVVRRIYGRPGKFQYTRRSANNAWFDIQAEYRRADTYAYSDIEYFVGPIAPNAAPFQVTRLDGNGDAWVRFYFTGPMTHPIVNYGSHQLEINCNIADGTSLEVNSYPWERRVLDSTGVNWRQFLIGNTVYLDQLNFPANTSMPVSWTCQSGTNNADTGLYFLWRESYHIV